MYMYTQKRFRKTTVPFLSLTLSDYIWDDVLVNSDRRKFESCMFGPQKMGIIRTRTVSHDNSDSELGPYE